MDEALTEARQAELAHAGARGRAKGPRSRRELSPPSERAQHSIHSVASRRFLARLRYQLLFGLTVAVAIPTLVASGGDPDHIVSTATGFPTLIGSTIAFLIATYLFRRIASFPGSGIFGHVLPALTAAYGVVLVVFFVSRMEYSRIIFFGGFIGAICFFLLTSYYIRNRVRQRFYLVPSNTAQALLDVAHVDWVILTEPSLPKDAQPVIIADLRADFDPEWERLISDAALRGHPVYHLKQVQESLTGRVDIEHLSENSFGSLLPNHSYLKVKRGIDLLICLVVLPLLIIPGLFVAGLIKLDTPGPVFFRQERRGHRGKTFRVLKFRTMAHGSIASNEREDAITRMGDERITRFGRFLRRTRIDELPQVWNVLRGEMSWIGPRPEALALSDWYAAELPFYAYRHILRPGITGWAQVNQGHVADIDSVFEKLHYDFYYIKHFSAWLDLLILGKTMAIVFQGNGSK